MAKNDMRYDDQLYNIGDEAWSDNPKVQKHIDKDWVNVLNDNNIERELKGLIREAQLKSREDKFLEYKIMFDTRHRRRFFIETAISNSQYGDYQPSGYLTSVAYYWHIEGYNRDNVWTTWVFTKKDITNMIGMDGVESLQGPDRAIPVPSRTSNGVRIQWTMGYGIPYGVLERYERQRLGETKYIQHLKKNINE